MTSSLTLDAPSSPAPAASVASVASAAAEGSSGGVASSGGGSAAFAQAWRARSYRRLGGALVAAGEVDGVRGRLVLPLERVAVAKVTYRSFASPLAVSAAAAGVVSAVSAAGDVLGLTGRVESVVSLPGGIDSGVDAEETGVWAAVQGLCEAAEVPLSAAARAAVVADLGGVAALPGEDGFGVHDEATGAWVRRFADAPRFHVLLWHRPGTVTSGVSGVGASSGRAGVGAVGVPAVGAGEVAWARWLTEVNGSVEGRLAEVCREVAAADERVLGVVGGHGPLDAVALLMSSSLASLEAARDVRASVLGRVGGAAELGGFVGTFARSGRTS